MDERETLSTGKILRLLFRLARPLFLLGSALLYSLGLGIARYLGRDLDGSIALLGLSWVLALQLSTHFLNEFFDAPVDIYNLNRTWFSGGSGALGSAGLPRMFAIWASAFCLTLTASLSVLLFQFAHPSPGVVVLLVLIFLGAIFYSLPPVHLARSGYGELTTSIVVANLVPALAFSLQAGELHRLLALTTMPLTALHLAMMLALELPDYATDLKHEKQTLMVRAGWQMGMQLHNGMILTAYVLLGLSILAGMPPKIALPAYLTLPLGLFQIWQIHRIRQGGRPYWQGLTLTAVALFGAVVYLLTYGFWVR
jgi:1,4-dihydroxy-2-naphthoate octaprenyltransferase